MELAETTARASYQPLLEACRELARQGKDEEAYAQSLELLKLAPEDAEALNLAGLAARSRGKGGEAVAHLVKAAALNPREPKYHLNLGVVLGALHRTEEAITALSRALALNPQYFEAHANIGNLYTRAGRFEEAAACYRRALAIQPGNDKATFNLAGALVQLKRLQEARGVLENYLTYDPASMPAHAALADILTRQGKREEVIALYRRCIQRQPELKGYHKSLAEALAALRRYPEAEAACKEALARWPEHADVLNNLATVYFLQKRYADAEALLRRAMQADAAYGKSYVNLAEVFRNTGREAEIAALLEDAAGRNLDSEELGLALGKETIAGGDMAGAKRVFEAVLAKKPASFEALSGLAHLAMTEGQSELAEALFTKALSLNTRHVYSMINLASLYFQRALAQRALAMMDQVMEIDPGNTGARRILAGMLLQLNDTEGAERRYREILELEPESPRAYGGLAAVEERRGNFAASLKWLERAPADALDEGSVGVKAKALHRLGRSEEAVAALKERLARPVMLPNDRAMLSFILGEILDAQKQYGEAFAAYKKGNDLRGGAIPGLYRGNDASEADIITRFFTKERMRAIPPSGVASELPVFIVGMPRSGTTLLERIIAAHPKGYAGGELLYIPNIVRNMKALLKSEQNYPDNLEGVAPEALAHCAERYLQKIAETLPEGKTRHVDKLPHNFKSLGLIARLFPSGKIIHAVRNPVDTCLSCYFQDFANGHVYARNLEWLAEAYVQYRRLMAHWEAVLDVPVLEVAYEDLVAEPEAETRRILEFLNLDWDPACLDFHEAKTTVATASYDQVRQPLYRKSAGRWKRYEPFIEPLLLALRARGVIADSDLI